MMGSFFRYYKIKDLIPFSKETYLRQIEIYNEFLWPFQIVVLLLILAFTFCIIKKIEVPRRLISIIIGIIWLQIGITFYIGQLSPIFKLAPHIGSIFIIESLLFFWIGGIRGNVEFIYQKNSNLENGSHLFFHFNYSSSDQFIYPK